MKSGDIVKLPNLEFTSSYLGYGAKGLSGSEAPGIEVHCSLTDQQIEIFKTNDAEELMAIVEENFNLIKTIPVEKIRVYGSEHYAYYIPNPKFSKYDPKEIFIKHIAAYSILHIISR